MRSNHEYALINHMTISRRLCLQWLFLLLSLVTIVAAKDSPLDKYLLFVGTYTEKGSKGIYAYRFDAASSELTPLGVAAETTNPSFLGIDPSRRFLYAVNEVQKYKSASSGSLSLRHQSPDRQVIAPQRSRLAWCRPLLHRIRQDR